MLKTDINIKVCIISGYPPGIGRGAEQIYVLGQALSHTDGINLTILANQMLGTPKESNQDGITVIRTWKPGSWLSLFNTTRALTRLKPDILHIHHPHLYYGSAPYTAIFITTLLLIARFKGVKSLIWWEHVYPPNKITRATMETYHYRASVIVLRIGLTCYTKIIGRLADRVLVQTDADLRTIRKYYGGKNAACLVIGMQAAPMNKNDARGRLGLTREQKVLLVFGFISPFKGVSYAIEAFPAVHSAYPNSILLIAGCTHPRLEHGMEYMASLQKTAEETGVGRSIIFHDKYIPASEHAIYYSAADIVLLPYISSLGPSSVGMESFLYGIPVVATDVDFIRDDIQNRKTGMIVPAADTLAIASAVTELFGNEALYNALIANIVSISQKYSSTTVAEELKGFYFGLKNPVKTATK